MPALQPMTGEITDEINALEIGVVHNDFHIHRIKRSIEKVRGVDVAESYMLSGMLYSVVGDFEQCVAAHEASVRNFRAPLFLQNYGFSMKRFGKSVRAFELIREAFDLEPTLESFVEVIMAALCAGVLVSSIGDAVDKFVKSNPSVDLAKVPGLANLSYVEDELLRAGVSGADYQAVLEVADNVLAQRHYMCNMVSLDGSSFDGVPYVSVELAIPARSVEDLIAINEEISEQVSASDIDAWDRVIVTVVPSKDHRAA